MGNTCIKTELQGSILVVTVNRPEALNAINNEVMSTLGEIVQGVGQNDEVRGVILTGEGDKAFVAGADIKELSVLNKQQSLELAQKGQKIFKSFEDCAKPVVAVVNGFALGGGCELAMACHVRIATENAKFGQPEVNLGIIPGYGGTQRLTQLVGRGKALELLLTGDMISATDAKALGLVNHVVATKREALELASKMLGKMISKAPIAIHHIIKSVNAGFAFEQKGYETEAAFFAECSTTEDFKEGTSAFLEKRKPTFTGK
ncbi:MAG TPA: enoyl-CoA hydratase-related protein [Sphingobacteriaceae bacterium]